MNYTEGPYATVPAVDESTFPSNGVSVTRGRITQDEILQFKADLVTYHSRRLSIHKEDEQYFKLTYNVPTPDQGRDPLISPTGYQLVQEIINHIVAEFPTIDIRPRTVDESENVRASKLTAWINGFWQHVDLFALMRDMLFFDCVRGCHVLRLMMDSSIWPKEPIPPVEPVEPADLTDITDPAITQYFDDLVTYVQDREDYRAALDEWTQETQDNLPIFVDVIDPRYILWEPTPNPKRCVVQWERTVDEVMETYPSTIKYLDTMRSGSKVTWCEYWDDTEYAYWIEPISSGGRTVRGNSFPYWVKGVKKHKFGFFPFIVDGPWVTPLEEPEMRYPSIYYATKAFLQYESTLYTRMAHIFNKLGWPALIVTTPDAKGGGKPPVIDMNPGAINYLDEDEKAAFLEYGGNTLQLLQQIVSNLEGKINDVTGLADILRGQPKGKSGYQQAQAIAQARVAFVPIEQCMTRTIRLATRGVLKLVVAGGDKITVIGPESVNNSETAIGPQDARIHGQIKVTLKTVLPLDEAARLDNYHKMQDWAWMDPIEAARLAGVENPEQKSAAALAWKYAQQPWVQEAEAILFIREHRPDLWEIIQQHDLITAQQQIAQQGTNPQVPVSAVPTPPPGPGSPQEQQLIQRQAKQGGTPPRRLPEEANLTPQTVG